MIFYFFYYARHLTLYTHRKMLTLISARAKNNKLKNVCSKTSKKKKQSLVDQIKSQHEIIITKK